MKVNKRIASPFYNICKMINKDSEEGPNILMMELKQQTIKLWKFIYCEMKILDLLKYHLDNIWYTVLKPQFGHALT